jgi:Tfp pilus assembly protein PilF
MAIARDRRDWRLWLASARIETKLGHVDAANGSLRRAVALNPRSPLFKGLFPATGEP